MASKESLEQQKGCIPWFLRPFAVVDKPITKAETSIKPAKMFFKGGEYEIGTEFREALKEFDNENINS